jgi:hypothetical protein
MRWVAEACRILLQKRRGENAGKMMSTSTASALNTPAVLAGGDQERLARPATVSAGLMAPGIVYGDLGTSPLYTLQTIMHIMGDQFTPEAALGSLSLVFWALIITISIKYFLSCAPTIMVKVGYSR